MTSAEMSTNPTRKEGGESLVQQQYAQQGREHGLERVKEGQVLAGSSARLAVQVYWASPEPTSPR